MPITGIGAEAERMRAEIEKFERMAVEEMKKGARIFMAALADNTVVWEGDVLRNYVWGRGGPRGGYRSPVGGRGGWPRGRGSRSRDTGQTGTMGRPPAGEPRRDANEAAATADMEAVLGGMQRLEDLFVRNTSDHADLVDSGSAPTPERSRHPGGVTRLAAQALRARMRNFK